MSRTLGAYGLDSVAAVRSHWTAGRAALAAAVGASPRAAGTGRSSTSRRSRPTDPNGRTPADEPRAPVRDRRRGPRRSRSTRGDTRRRASCGTPSSRSSSRGARGDRARRPGRRDVPGELGGENVARLLRGYRPRARGAEATSSSLNWSAWSRA
jgi:hypothetical protein